MYKSFIKDYANKLNNNDKPSDINNSMDKPTELTKERTDYKKLYYTLTMNNIKRNNNILFEGCDAHGLFYSCNYQVITPYDNILTDNLSDEEIQLFPEITSDEEIQLFSEIKLNNEIKLFSKSQLDEEIELIPNTNIDNNSTISDTNQKDVLRSTIDNKIIFDKYDNILNIELMKDSGYIKILKTGIYIVNLSCQFNEKGEMIICVNDIPDLLSVTKTIMPHNFITIHHVLNLKCDDILSFHNYSPDPLTTYVIDDNINSDIDNVCLHIWMISSQLV